MKDLLVTGIYGNLSNLGQSTSIAAIRWNDYRLDANELAQQIEAWQRQIANLQGYVESLRQLGEL